MWSRVNPTAEPRIFTAEEAVTEMPPQGDIFSTPAGTTAWL